MAIWQRMSRIIQANLNALSEKTDSPREAVDSLIREMEQVVLDLRHSAAVAVSSRKTIERSIRRATEDPLGQRQEAEDAGRCGDDGHARTAVHGEAPIDSHLASLRARLQEEEDVTRRVEDELRRAEDELLDIKTRRDMLMSQRARLSTREQRSRSVGRSDGLNRDGEGHDVLARLEDSVQEQMDEVEAAEQLAAEARTRSAASRDRH